MREQAESVITIDGPSGSGKGTISRRLALHLGWHLLDSGALYRVLAMAAHQHAVSYDDEVSLEVLAAHLDVQFVTPKGTGTTRVVLEGRDVSDAIRTKTWASAASQVGVFQSVRTALLARQRAFLQAPGLVADGRDMGSVIFPNAVAKFYLDASAKARAQRRYKQLQQQGIDVSLGSLLSDMAERDERDKTRKAAPLKPAEDAQVIDTTELSIDAVFEVVKGAVSARLAEV